IVVFMIAIYLGLEDFIPKKFKKYSQDYAKSLLLGEISVGIQIDKKKVLQWFLKLMGKEIIARPDHSENDLSEKYNQAIRDLEISINFESIKQNFFDLILEINIEERTIISNMMDSPSFPKSL